jgi:hypothetical protein
MSHEELKMTALEKAKGQLYTLFPPQDYPKGCTYLASKEEVQNLILISIAESLEKIAEALKESNEGSGAIGEYVERLVQTAEKVTKEKPDTEQENLPPGKWEGDTSNVGPHLCTPSTGGICQICGRTL